MLMLGGDTSAQLRYILHQAELLNTTHRPSDIKLKNLNLKELISISSEYMTYEGSLTWPGCFESVTWIIFNQYQQVLSTYLQTLFPNILRFSNNRQISNIGINVQRNVRTNIGYQQWFRSSPSTNCYPINNILEYHINNDFDMART
jgi:carbonic anhydrase